MQSKSTPSNAGASLSDLTPEQKALLTLRLRKKATARPEQPSAPCASNPSRATSNCALHSHKRDSGFWIRWNPAMLSTTWRQRCGSEARSIRRYWNGV